MCQWIYAVRHDLEILQRHLFFDISLTQRAAYWILWFDECANLKKVLLKRFLRGWYDRINIMIIKPWDLEFVQVDTLFNAPSSRR